MRWRFEEPDEHGEVVVRGQFRAGGWPPAGGLYLPDCDCCGAEHRFYLYNLPHEWRMKEVEVRVRLLDKE